jgi:uncharacterized protein DUF6285
VTADSEAGLHGRPTVAELLVAVREFLAGEVFPVTEGHVQFHTRVAVRVLDTVLRELELGTAQEEAHSQRLAALGYDTDRDLAEAIRAGRYDADIAGLAAALEPDVRAKLEVADPRYLADCDPFR